MSSVTVRTVTLMGATMTMGFAASVFALYAHTIMPGLHTTDDRTFVGAFQAIDRAIINPWFMTTAFVGPLVLAVASTIANLRQPLIPWVAAALVLFLVAVVITLAINVPLNDAIKAAGDPDRISDLARVREQFHETRWAVFNVVRAVTSTTAFGCLAWALVMHGRST